MPPRGDGDNGRPAAVGGGAGTEHHRAHRRRRWVDLPLGEGGEIVAEGPQVVAGYWGKPQETEASLLGGALKSGDVGVMGWVFIVDREKDMINVSGYQVWPREVEDVLAEHPAVRESAVSGCRTRSGVSRSRPSSASTPVRARPRTS